MMSFINTFLSNMLQELSYFWDIMDCILCTIELCVTFCIFAWLFCAAYTSITLDRWDSNTCMLKAFTRHRFMNRFTWKYRLHGFNGNVAAVAVNIIWSLRFWWSLILVIFFIFFQSFSMYLLLGSTLNVWTEQDSRFWTQKLKKPASVIHWRKSIALFIYFAKHVSVSEL